MSDVVAQIVAWVVGALAFVYVVIRSFAAAEQRSEFHFEWLGAEVTVILGATEDDDERIA